MSEQSDEAVDLRALLDPRAVRLDAVATDRDDAIAQVGAALLATGAVDQAYVDTMLARERSVSTFVGEGVAIPHGTLAGKDAVHRDALSLLRFPAGVDWGGHPVSVAIGIAATGNGHVALLARLADILLDPTKAAALRRVEDLDEVYRLFTEEEEEDD